MGLIETIIIVIASATITSSLWYLRSRFILFETSKRRMIERRNEKFISDARDFFMPLSSRALGIADAFEKKFENKFVFYRLARYLHENRRFVDELGWIYLPGGKEKEEEVLQPRARLRDNIIDLFDGKANSIEKLIEYYRGHKSYGSFAKNIGVLKKEFQAFKKKRKDLQRAMTENSRKLSNLLDREITKAFKEWTKIYKPSLMEKIREKIKTK